jgi:hypothetical protein
LVRVPVSVPHQSTPAHFQSEFSACRWFRTARNSSPAQAQECVQIFVVFLSFLPVDLVLALSPKSIASWSREERWLDSVFVGARPGAQHATAGQAQFFSWLRIRSKQLPPKPGRRPRSDFAGRNLLLVSQVPPTRLGSRSTPVEIFEEELFSCCVVSRVTGFTFEPPDQMQVFLIILIEYLRWFLSHAYQMFSKICVRF